jgi:hypothetical protein
MMTTTKGLPPDPEDMNTDRARWAYAALVAFMDVTGCDEQEAPGDLLADLMHWCDRNGMDFEAVLEGARTNYRQETDAGRR